MHASSTLPRAWVERIFFRLQGVYGDQFVRKYSNGQIIEGRDVGYENAMQVWSEELGGFVDNHEAIAYGLKNIDADFPPSARKFAELCRMAPRPQLAALPEPKIDPVRARQSAQKAQEAVHGKKDMHGWAKRPASQHALNLLIKWAREGDSQAKGYLKNLMEAGHVEGATLIHKWDMGQWVRA